MRSNLERRYRALLRLLPAWYRAEREEEMVGIFLADRTDDLDLEHGWPGWGETGATLALAVRVRLGARRPAGTVARLLGLTGLLGLLVAAAQSWTVTLRSGWAVDTQGWWFDLAAVAAFAALVAGRRALGRVAAGLLGAMGLVPVVWSVAVGFPPWLTLLWYAPTCVAAVAVVAGFHREAPPVPRVWWAIALTGLVAGGASVLFAPGLSSTTVLAAWLIAAVVVAAFRPWSVRRSVPAA
ncbi:hypothetical protein B0I31_102628 [Saccharothrix carnea]|uniref:Uncharacterized protein n=1 Tax=Saccharothrix carnea TaxID=1280637 RepID=A0A2P8IGR1_SACCR|nr:hypothetical protein [Saccharothrix carnea]PSL57649.1 hypothetical protein B0I31_102628 [Saccharothrix carnea]